MVCNLAEGNWTRVGNANQALAALETSTEHIITSLGDEGEQIVIDEMQKSEAMTNEFISWARTQSNMRMPTEIWWSAKPNSLFGVMDGFITSQSNPSDIITVFDNKYPIGISAKSAGKSGKVSCFKNIGLGTISKFLGVRLESIYEGAVLVFNESVSKTHNRSLSNVAKDRKKQIRSNPHFCALAIQHGRACLKAIRDELIESYQQSSHEDRIREHLLIAWLNADSGMNLGYVKITGKKTKDGYSAVVDDIERDTTIDLLRTQPITFRKSGDTSIIVQAHGIDVFRIRIKFESQMMASSIKLAGETLD